MFKEHTKAIRSSLQQALERKSHKELGIIMFDLFLKRYPETEKIIFADTVIPDFAARKFRAVSELIVDSVRSPDYATYQMVSEIQRHTYFDVKDGEYYYTMADDAMEAVKQTLGDDWTDELEEYWTEGLQATKACIQQAIREAI